MQPRRIAFLHPDLGIGGAERLVVDAAVGLQSCGNHVTVFTSHCSPSHSFPETQDGTLRVKVYGDWLPTTIFGRCKALFAAIRMLYVAVWMILTEKMDIVILDQVSHPIPLFKLFRIKTLFYCHYPDKLLTQRHGILKKLYRAPLDYFEEFTTGLADEILVNSKFTAGIFRQAFSRIHREPKVLYPSINFDSLSREVDVEHTLAEHDFVSGTYFLSINRFERKKNIALAVEAFSVLHTILSPAEFENLHLVIAGGYDPQLAENREVYHELKTQVNNEGLNDHVTFMPSFSDDEKIALLSKCFAVVYTPSNEHFGIVPVEGMYFEKPVIAVNSGGPMESIEHEQTGLLCDANAADFSAAMNSLLKHKDKAKSMGVNGKRRTEELFSLEQFGSELNSVVESLLL
mmetsp:Transcript_22056/g.28158  ORF Transcript_22056/g.28158 Transcript_22056/m.28158 type:complete len:402 (-) Transcript_22056:53-1258(-)